MGFAAFSSMLGLICVPGTQAGLLDLPVHDLACQSPLKTHLELHHLPSHDSPTFCMVLMVMQSRPGSEGQHRMEAGVEFMSGL